MPREADPNQINFFAKTNFRNREVPFGIKSDDRRRHMYVIGKTGMGKTTMMENMAIQDIRNGHGVCFIDPHGDSVAKILDYIPNDRINDVIYFNPADLEFPVAFNILEAVETKYKHLVASGLMGVFTKIWANLWSARMEYILNNTVLALLDSPGNTMLGITRMYVDKNYRKKIIDNIKDPMVRSFWVDEWANLNEKFRTEAVAPIQNKVGQFLSSAVIRNIVGQPKSTLDLRHVMDTNKILLMDLSKGKVGEDNSALLGAMIITKLQLAALSRVDIPEQERSDFYLYVDEFQNFATESFATILSEARKYHLNLVVGHQYIGQLSNDRNNTTIRDAVFGNVGTIVCFRVGASDAEFLETEFAPTFAPIDLVNQQKYHIILKLMINGVSSDPFTAKTIPVDTNFFTGNSEKVIKVSRERFANPVLQVEDKISRWMGMGAEDKPSVLLGQTESVIRDEIGIPLPAPTEKKVAEPIQEPFENVVEPVTEKNSQESEVSDNVDTKEITLEDQTAQVAKSNAEKLPEQKKIVGEYKVPDHALRPRPFGERGDQQQNRSKFNSRKPYKKNHDTRRQKTDHSQKSKPAQKKHNPIWDKVAEIEQSKTKQSGIVFDQVEKVQDQKPDNTQKQTVVKPGESIKF